MEKHEADLRDEKGLSMDQALYTKNRNKGGSNKNNSDQRNTGKPTYFKGNCEGCHKYGHKQQDCWFEDKNASKRPANWKQTPDHSKQITSLDESAETMWVMHDIVNALQEGIIDRKNDWILDSACSNHMMPNKHGFISTTYRILAPGERVIETATGEKINATGVGNIKITLLFGKITKLQFKVFVMFLNAKQALYQYINLQSAD
jgi:hypothetical protein